MNWIDTLFLFAGEHEVVDFMPFKGYLVCCQLARLEVSSV